MNKSLLKIFENEKELEGSDYASLPYGELVHKDGQKLMKLKVRTNLAMPSYHKIYVGDIESLQDNRNVQRHLQKVENDVSTLMNEIKHDTQKVQEDRNSFLNKAVEVVTTDLVKFIGVTFPLGIKYAGRHSVQEYLIDKMPVIANVHQQLFGNQHPAYKELTNTILKKPDVILYKEHVIDLFQDIAGGQSLSKQSVIKTVKDMIHDLDGYLEDQQNTELFNYALFGEFDEMIDAYGDEGLKYMYAHRLSEGLQQTHDLLSVYRNFPGGEGLHHLLEEYDRHQNLLVRDVSMPDVPSLHFYKKLFTPSKNWRFSARKTMFKHLRDALAMGIHAGPLVAFLGNKFYGSGVKLINWFAHLAGMKTDDSLLYPMDVAKVDTQRIQSLQKIMDTKDQGLNLIKAGNELYQNATMNWVDQDYQSRYINAFYDYIFGSSLSDKIARVHDAEFDYLSEKRQKGILDQSDYVFNRAKKRKTDKSQK